MRLRRVNGKDFRWQRTRAIAEDVLERVRQIVYSVREQGDPALRMFAAQLDGYTAAADPNFSFRVDPLEAQRAWEQCSPSVQEALSAAASRIRDFHQAQLPVPVERIGDTGDRTGMVWRPLQRVGVYAPGGRGAYPSTVLMDVIPAQAAGVREIVLVSPPAPGSSMPHPTVLAAAHLLGIDEIYRVGGAHAIAALAYGTSAIGRVDKIVGTGEPVCCACQKAGDGRCRDRQHRWTE